MSLSNRVGKDKSSGGEEEDQRSSRRRLAETGFKKGGEGKGRRRVLTRAVFETVLDFIDYLI